MTRVIKLGPSNEEFTRKVNDMTNDMITLCEQCGICSTSRPVAEDMDMPPSEIMRLVQLGDEYVLETQAIWVCASCFTCTVRCPRGVDLAKVNEALRQIKLRQNINYLDIDRLDPEEVEDLPAIALVSAMRKYTG